MVTPLMQAWGEGKTEQKTWVDLLGRNCKNCEVEGKFIVRVYDDNSRLILWSFDNRAQAISVYNQWKKEIFEKKT